MMPLAIATSTYALVAFLGRPAWSWSVLGMVVLVDLLGEVMSASSGAWLMVILSLLAHAGWDLLHWRRSAVVSHSFAQWRALLDLTLGSGILLADFAW